AIDRDHPAARLAADRVGREALAVVDVVDLDPLVLADPGRPEQVLVDRARTLVVQLGTGHGGAVDLGFEQGDLHGGLQGKRGPSPGSAQYRAPIPRCNMSGTGLSVPGKTPGCRSAGWCPAAPRPAPRTDRTNPAPPRPGPAPGSWRSPPRTRQPPAARGP